MIQEPNISLLVYVAADLKLCSSKKGVSPDDGDGGSMLSAQWFISR